MKKVLSLMLAVIFAIGICLSAPITLTANAASPADDLTFVLNSDKKSYSVSKYPESNITDDGVVSIELVIPSKYKGLPVTKINTYAFSGCEAVKSIVIPDSVTEIDERAFYNCSFLTKIEMSKNIKEVGMWCFSGTKFFDDAKNWENNVLYCGNVLVEAKENISGAYTIKKGTKCIANSAFRFREKLTSVTIPSTVTHIGAEAFYGCALSKVIIPEGVVSIGWAAFGGNQKLTTITISKSVKVIKNDALINCEKLKTVNYNGTKEQWSKIEIGTYNTHLSKAKLVCTGKKVVLATPSVKTSNSAKGIKLSWGAVDKAESYRVYRRTYNTSTKKYSKWTTLNKAVKGTSYVDTKVKLGTTYSYMVKAENGGVLSKGTATKNLKYNVTPKVTVKTVTGGVSVSWITAANATGYTIYSSTYNAKTKKWSKFTSRGTVKSTAKSWTDKKAKSGTKYKYTVKAMNGKVASSYNKNGVEILFLATPTTKIANASSGVSVKWNKIGGAKNYRIYRSTYNTKTKKWSDWSTLVTVKNNVVSYTDKKVKSGTTYRYTVKALNGKVASSNKATGKLIFLSLPEAKISNASNGIKVSWKKVAGAKSYIVYSATYDAKNKKWSSWTNRGTIEAAKLSWTDTKVQSGVQYKYTLKAVNGDYKSTNKSSSAIVYLVPPVVTVEASGKVANIKWTKSAGAEGYIVYRSEFKNDTWSDWTEIFKGNNSIFEYCDVNSNVSGSPVYRYTVKAIKGKFKSATTATNSVYLLATPEVEAKLASSEIVVSWKTVPSAESYNVYISVKNGGYWSKWQSVATGYKELTYKDSNISFLGEYRYAIEAVSADGTVSSKGESSSVKAEITPVVTATCKDDGIHVSWSKINGADNYKLERGIYNSSTGKVEDWVDIDYEYEATSYIDAVTSSGNYVYRVTGKKGYLLGTSGVSAVVKCNAPVYVKISDKTINFGSDLNAVKSVLGNPTEVLQNQAFNKKNTYCVYASDYSKLTVVTLTDVDGVVSVYTLDPTAVFKTGYVETSLKGFNNKEYVFNGDYLTEYFIDWIGTNTAYAVLFTLKDTQANIINTTGDTSCYEKLNFYCVNACRVINGVKPLAYSDTIAAVSRAHSQDMANRNYFSHSTPEGVTSAERLINAGIDWRSCGENIAAGHRVPFAVNDGWYNSDGHRSNMLNTNFTHMGAGFAYNISSDYEFYCTQNFVMY